MYPLKMLHIIEIVYKDEKAYCKLKIMIDKSISHDFE